MDRILCSGSGGSGAKGAARPADGLAQTGTSVTHAPFRGADAKRTIGRCALHDIPGTEQQPPRKPHPPFRARRAGTAPWGSALRPFPADAVSFPGRPIPSLLDAAPRPRHAVGGCNTSCELGADRAGPPMSAGTTCVCVAGRDHPAAIAAESRPRPTVEPIRADRLEIRRRPLRLYYAAETLLAGTLARGRTPASDSAGGSASTVGDRLSTPKKPPQHASPPQSPGHSLPSAPWEGGHDGRTPAHQAPGRA